MSDLHEPEHVLDQALASTLQRAAEQRAQLVDEAPLDAAAQQRVLVALQRESRRLAQARRTRVVLATLAVAASLTVWLWPHALPSPAVPQAAACGLPVGPLHFSSSGARQLLTLGRYGTLVASAESVLTVHAEDPCALTVELAAGTLAAELHSLRPARLTIRTREADVQVRGTTFAVRADEALEVTLLEGAVDVLLRDPQRATSSVSLAAGHVLRRRQDQHDVRPVSEREQRAVRALLSGEPEVALPSEPEVAPVPEPRVEPRAPAVSKSSTELLAEAERARRADKLELARTRYAQAGAGRGPDAEVALLRWARLDLSNDAADAAHATLRGYRQRFPHGRLLAESMWLEARALEQLQRHDEAAASARELLQRFPGSPHADAARALLAAPHAP